MSTTEQANLLPTRVAFRKERGHRRRKAGVRVIENTAEENAVVALRLALLADDPEHRCFFFERDLDVEFAQEGYCKGSVVCQRAPDSGKNRLAVPRKLRFDIYWERTPDEFSLPTIKTTKYTITEE